MATKVYLSGPSYLLKNGEEVYEEMYKLCEAYGFEVLRQPKELFNHKSTYEEGVALAKKRSELIKECDLIIADCNDLYTSVEPFGEVGFELGYAYALDKKLYCYIKDARYCQERWQHGFSEEKDGRKTDENGITFEPQTLNVMLDNPSKVIEGDLKAALEVARKDFA